MRDWRIWMLVYKQKICWKVYKRQKQGLVACVFLKLPLRIKILCIRDFCSSKNMHILFSWDVLRPKSRTAEKFLLYIPSFLSVIIASQLTNYRSCCVYLCLLGYNRWHAGLDMLGYMPVSDWSCWPRTSWSSWHKTNTWEWKGTVWDFKEGTAQVLCDREMVLLHHWEQAE